MEEFIILFDAELFDYLLKLLMVHTADPAANEEESPSSQSTVEGGCSNQTSVPPVTCFQWGQCADRQVQ